MRAISIVLALMLVALPAWAQTTAPVSLPPDAQAAVDKGVLAARQQDFLLAIRYFQDARKLAPRAPEIYYDLGLAESKIPGRELRAIAWFGAFLAATPNATNAAAVKDLINVLDVKSQSNLSSSIRTLQDTFTQLPYPNVCDDYCAAEALNVVAEAKVHTGDLAGALRTASMNKNAFYKCWTLKVIADAETRSGDIAGANETLSSEMRTVGLIQDPSDKARAQADIAVIQAEAGDPAGARETFESALKTVNLIQDAAYKSGDQLYIAEAQLKAGSTNNPDSTAGPATITQAPIQSAVPIITVSDWLKKLDDSNKADDCALNTDPFLDLAGSLKSLPLSNDPQKVFQGLRETAGKIVTAQNVIDKMLKQQAKQ